MIVIAKTLLEINVEGLRQFILINSNSTESNNKHVTIKRRKNIGFSACYIMWLVILSTTFACNTEWLHKSELLTSCFRIISCQELKEGSLSEYATLLSKEM